MDVNGDGCIDFQEFSIWWHRDQVTYTLKRSEPVPATRCPTVSYATKTYTETDRWLGWAGLGWPTPLLAFVLLFAYT